MTVIGEVVLFDSFKRVELRLKHRFDCIDEFERKVRAKQRNNVDDILYLALAL